MADTKISALTSGGDAQAADAFVVARSGNNYRIAGTDVAAAATKVGTLASLAVSGNTTIGGTLAVTGQITGNITGAVTGNASTATALQTARTINGVSFDGTANITVAAAAGTLTGTALNSTVVTSSLTAVGTISTGVWQGTAIADTYLTTISTAGKVANSATTAASANTASAIVARDASGNFSAGTITATLSGNAATATALQTARTINGVSFNGTADITVTAAAGTLTGNTLASNVTASSLTSVGTLSSLTVSGLLSSSVSSGNNVTLNNTASGNQVYANLTSGATTLGSLYRPSATNDIRLDSGFGSVVFGTGTAGTATARMSIDTSGNLAVDTNTLYVDAVNNRVGVGTASPTDTFHVEGASMLLKNGTGNVDLKLGITGYGMSLNYATGAVSIKTNTSDRLTVDNSGNLGLGTTPSPVSSSDRVLQVNRFLFDDNTNGYGILRWNNYYDGTNDRYIASFSASAFQMAGNAFRWYQAPSGTAGAAITFTQAMTLDASGTLLVATTSKYGSEKLTVRSGVADALSWWQNTTSGRPVFGLLAFDGAQAGQIGAQYSTDYGMWLNGTGHVAFQTNSTERARITSGGYFKASDNGTYRSATASYHEFQQNAASSNTIVFDNRTATPFGVLISYPNVAPNGTSNEFLACGDSAGGQRAAIRSNGGLANYSANDVNLSDLRVKKDITPVATYWSKIKAIEVVTFKYNDQTHDDTNVGVIAQQVEAVAPEFVDADGFGETPADGIPLKAVYNTDLQFAALRALQEAMARIETLEARVAALGA